MRTRIFAVMIFAAVATLTGCVRFHTDVTIDQTGGGTAQLTMAISPEVLAALTEMQKMDPNGNGANIPDLGKIDRAAFDKRAKGRGVTIRKFEKTDVAGKENLKVDLAFVDLKGLSYVLGGIAGGDGQGMGIFSAEGGNLVLRSTAYDFPAEPAKVGAADSAEMTPEQMQKQMALAGKLMSAMAELDISLKVTVPGDVVKSNAPKVEARTSIWTINAQNMMDQQGSPEPEIVFSGKGLKIKPLAP